MGSSEMTKSGKRKENPSYSNVIGWKLEAVLTSIVISIEALCDQMRIKPKVQKRVICVSLFCT